ncbi:acyl-protein synthetase [Nonomuraea lactucae]|uniref:LuxE/PaaK family acyltransferase n=1 Tax=Nonomuraea lactucae TaxID=2249762 RepID=UPI0013B4376D|nr:acyl-protein synthetase [Nonomuraea lactucae]
MGTAVGTAAAEQPAGVFTRPPYSTDGAWKRTVFRDLIVSLTEHHRAGCPPYRRVLDAMRFTPGPEVELEEVPFLPAGLFKRLTLVSVPRSERDRVLTSSGTGGRNVSRVVLDRTTALLQMRALATIVTGVLGTSRLPLLVVDCPRVTEIPGRAVAVLGFSMFGSGRTFALTDDLRPDLAAINAFLDRTAGGPFLVFGMTSIIWRHLLTPLRERGTRLDLAGATVIHGGGWKSLAGVGDGDFRKAALELTGARRVIDYYGMAEQAGSVFLQCPEGFLHCSTFSEVFTRRPRDFLPCAYGEPGILQTLSVLPRSYPGHSLLTEDEGVVFGEDDCRCGRRGRYFVVTRRLPAAEAKGCGDVR